MQCPPLFGSSVRAIKPILAINVRTSKPISNHVSVSNVRPREPISSSHARSSKIVSASNVCPSKTGSASNVCSGKPVCTMSVQVDLSVEVTFVKVNQQVIVPLFVQTIFVSLIHQYQLNRYHLYFYFPFLAYSVL